MTANLPSACKMPCDLCHAVSSARLERDCNSDMHRVCQPMHGLTCMHRLLLDAQEAADADAEVAAVLARFCESNSMDAASVARVARVQNLKLWKQLFDMRNRAVENGVRYALSTNLCHVTTRLQIA